MEDIKKDSRSNKMAAMQACVDHARALLESARAVQRTGHPNIAYHLAVLTLEELGRRELIAVQMISETRPVPPAWVQNTVKIISRSSFGVFLERHFLRKN
jgi:AbiV